MSEEQTRSTNYGALATLTTVFFFWGFIAAGNSVFIPFCKSKFHLDQFQSQLIDFAFYGAYYLGALALFVIGSTRGRDLVGQWGYKKSIVFGLLFSALGAIVMILSVYADLFSGMLFGFFVVALGFSLQQTSANPFMISLGDESTGTSRISLGGGINSLGTTIGPLIVALALFGSAAAVDPKVYATLSMDKVNMLYACVAVLFIAIAVLFGFSKKLPNGIRVEKTERSKKAIFTLAVITALLIACFVPVFNSYYQESANKDLIQLKHDLEQVSLDEQGNPINKMNSTQINTEKAIQSEIDKIKKPIEQQRINWLSAGLLVI
ncbi:MAG: MFS transporter, partial [Flavobacteriales bacterium]